MKSVRFLVGLCLLVPALASGCMRVGPDYQRPDIGAPPPESFQHDPIGQAGKRATLEELVPSAVADQMSDDWWRAFGDEELNRLVAEALERNWDIQAAAARVLEAGAGFRQVRADRFPTLGIKGEADKTSTPMSIQVPTVEYTPPASLKIGSKTLRRTEESDKINLSAGASFELDFWGKVARAEEASRAALLQAQESRVTVIQTVVAEVVSTYLEIECLERRIAVADNNIATAKTGRDLVEGRYNRGLADALAVRQSRRALAQAEAALPALRQDLGLDQQKLAVLVGRYPRTSTPRSQPEEYYLALDPVPPGLPSELLLRRPDVRAAEANLAALNAKIGVAKASRFPSISLTGAYGWTSDGLGYLTDVDNVFWTFGLDINLPIFTAGKLKAAQRAAEAKYQQGVAEYAKTVLKAFSEVEGALLRRKELTERRELLVAFLREARAAQAVAENRYERGLTAYLNVLEARQTRYQAEDSLALADLALFTNRVGLHRALGGGWADPGPVDLSEPEEPPMKFDPTLNMEAL